jgi:hypothetical protein
LTNAYAPLSGVVVGIVKAAVDEVAERNVSTVA